MIWTTMTADDRLNVKPYQFAGKPKRFIATLSATRLGERYATPVNKRCAI